ncbi:PKD domain-containing protein, partial [bacterium AH-315-M05]|nr:PKD domain-containing protein [bacterium AH-315-M05]
MKKQKLFFVSFVYVWAITYIIAENGAHSIISNKRISNEINYEIDLNCLANTPAKLWPYYITINVSATTICLGQCITISATASGGHTPPYVFTWTNGVPNSTGGTGTYTVGPYTLCPTVTTTYNVSVTDAYNYMPPGTDVVTITVVPTGPLTLTMSSTPASCGINDGTATVTASGGTPPYNYQWDPGTGNQTTQTATGLFAGTYSVIVTDDSGCNMDTATVTITGPGGMSVSITSSNNPSCNGGNDGEATATVSGGGGALTYLWTPSGGVGATGTGLSGGITYTVTVTDDSGCTAIDNITLTDPLVLTANITSSINPTCNGANNGYATVTANGGTGSYTYLWTPSGGVGATGTGLSGGITYTVTVTDANGCIGSDNIGITEPAPLTATGSSSPSTCGNANGVATVNPLGGTQPYSFLWDDPDSQTTATATGLLADTFTVVITDANNCTLTFPVTLTDVAGPVIDSITTTDVICNGESTGSATVSINGGTLPFTYLWDDSLAQTTITSLYSFTATGLVAGLVSVTVTDLNGCIVTGSVTVSEPNPLIVNTFGTDICDGSSSQISATTTGGTGAYSYSWDNGLSDTTAHIVSPNMTTTYTVIVIDDNGCLDSATITVIVFPPLTVSDSIAEICEGESVVLSATPSGGNGGPYYYTWSDGSTGSSITVSPLAPITYTVIVSDSCSPDDTAIVNVIVNPLPTANFDAACFPDPFIKQFTNNSSPISGSVFLWDFGDGSPPVGGQNPSHVFSSSGDYTVNLTITT